MSVLERCVGRDREDVTVDGLLSSYDRALHQDLSLPAQLRDPRELRPAER